MTRRELTKRGALAAGALVCLGLALVLALLAVDVARWDHALASGDVRYRVTPDAERLWEANELSPLGLGAKVLGVGDDVDFRRAVRALRLANLDDTFVSISDPEVVIRRNEAQARLEGVVARDTDPTRRSRAAGLLGVLGLARFVTETEERGALLSSTVTSLQLAIALDPDNDEAKHNLELALQRGRGYQLTEGSAGANPSPGGSGASGAGAGQPGTGY
jgi:hypothetical protein